MFKQNEQISHSKIYDTSEWRKKETIQTIDANNIYTPNIFVYALNKAAKSAKKCERRANKQRTQFE